MRRRHRQFTVLVLVTTTVLGLVAASTAPYFLAMHQDRVCFTTAPLMRATVESCLFLYTVSDCEAENRVPGVDYASGTCVSYNILGVEPIHVIYDSDSHVVTHVSVYE